MPAIEFITVSDNGTQSIKSANDQTLRNMLYGYRVRLQRAQRTGDTTLASRMTALIADAESKIAAVPR